MADISKIRLPSGTTYDIKDATARTLIEELQSYTDYLGVSATALSDGSTTNPITIGTTQVTAKKGNIVNYNSKEFIFNGTAWQEFGDLSALGDLAYKNTASTTYKPKGNISAPAFSGKESSVTITATANNNGNYQPAGQLTPPAFTGQTTTFTGNFQPKGSVSVQTATTTGKTTTVSAAQSGDVTYQPTGQITAPAFTGQSTTFTGSFQPHGEIDLTTASTTATVSAAQSGTTTYQPDGEVGTPTISVKTAGATQTIKNPTSVTVAKTVVAAAPGATAPSNAITYYNVADETLSLYQLGYTTGASITTANVTVKTGDAVYQSSQPSFTGSAVRLVTSGITVPTSAAFSGQEESVSVSGNPKGKVAAPQFTGDGVRLVTGNIAVPSTYKATWTGTEESISVSGKPKGSVAAPTFTGTKVQISGVTTADGDVLAPTFTGTQETITVS